MKMHDLLIFTAASMPEDIIISKLKEAIDKYQAGNKEAKKEIIIMSGLLMTKDSIGDTMEDMMKASNKFNEMSKFSDLMKGTS